MVIIAGKRQKTTGIWPTFLFLCGFFLQFIHACCKSLSFMSEQKTINNSRLITILRTFDRDELKRFDKFVQSPYFNTNPNVYALYKYLKKFAPDFSSDIYKVPILNKVYSKKYSKQAVLSTNDNKLLNDLVYKLARLTEEFLAYAKFDKKTIFKHSLTIDSLLDRKLTDEVSSIFRKAESSLKKMPHKDRDYYLSLIHI